jgi:hypothetical protein
MAERIEPSKVLEVLVQNAQRGERYRVKLVNDPVVYEGIPLSTPGATTQDDDTFRLDVTAPPEQAGMLHSRISNIEWIEPIR